VHICTHTSSSLSSSETKNYMHNQIIYNYLYSKIVYIIMCVCMCVYIYIYIYTYSLGYFLPLFLMPSHFSPKLLIPTMPLALMTLIKHDYLITINLMHYVLHPPLTHRIPLCDWPLMVIKSKSFWSVQPGPDTCPGHRDEGAGALHTTFRCPSFNTFVNRISQLGNCQISAWLE
jgi:hypothetical protein